MIPMTKDFWTLKLEYFAPVLQKTSKTEYLLDVKPRLFISPNLNFLFISKQFKKKLSFIYKLFYLYLNPFLCIEKVFFGNLNRRWS